jgi:L-ascorbate metabolism protein UlaG (beta-lactamase superfamily)
MIPVVAYEPRWFMKGMHMNPSDALEAFKILQATHGLGMHLETFQLTDEAREEPRRDFLKILPPELQKKFEILDIGESRIFSKPGR